MAVGINDRPLLSWRTSDSERVLSDKLNTCVLAHIIQLWSIHEILLWPMLNLNKSLSALSAYSLFLVCSYFCLPPSF